MSNFSGSVTPFQYHTVHDNCKKGNPTKNHFSPEGVVKLESAFLYKVFFLLEEVVQCKGKHKDVHSKRNNWQPRTMIHGVLVFSSNI